ncbi:DNA-binding transcriptional regulator, XRE-family HTH domain [Chitinophaga jiangningensis]|uniref:DNA-binding transcriptional regulator, XRE-family HTH domain n=1 Tax=Chitinophaga jiangningensis TaxID=1419482 RepID=A0A1M6WJE1_9BACT|nr:helix-turn-helix transcriptional regulator [Chitinophaga jiangningensis]SHK93837.1 DNA-binding transcriptional regulator, XRE-family HTH domain [Chitinophaga jiangningensis]
MNPNTINRNLYYLRTSKGLTQQQVAEALNIARSTYTGYESKWVPDLETQKSLAKYYNININDLLNKEMMPAEEVASYMAKLDRNSNRGGKADTKKPKQIKSPFPADDELNWERAEILATKRATAMAISKVYALLGTPRTYEEVLADIDDDRTTILADLRAGRLSFGPSDPQKDREKS